MKIDNRYKYTGSSNYNYNDLPLSPTGIALFDTKTGVGGWDYMPYDGATVTVTTGQTSNKSIRNFNPSLNNTIYYLVSDTEYTAADRDTILSLATPVAVTLVLADIGYKYTGTFVFNNPSNYEFLYLIFDYTDSIVGGTGAYIGPEATKYIDVNFGSDIGVAGFDFVTNGDPARYVIEWNGQTVADTGYVGLNSQANYDDLIAAGVDAADIKLQTPLDGLVDNGTDSMRFRKFAALAEATLTVYTPLTTNDWEVTQVDPALTLFYMDPDAGTLANVCAQIPDTAYYHDGDAALPTLGDKIYTTSTGSALFDGGNAYHIINATALGAPPVSGGQYVGIDTGGIVQSEAGCDCTEIAAPTVDQADLDLVVGVPVDIIISATNNPTSWAVDGACETFELTGGTEGSIYSVTFCDTTTKNVSVNVGSTVRVSATAATLSFGGGSATSIGVDDSFYIPDGLSFNTTTGRLYGTPTEACAYSVDFIATNCFGSSAATTVIFTIATGIQLTPFLLDTENISTTGADACLITPTYSMLYHNGIGDTPALNDTIFTDHNGLNPLMGGGRWYNVGDSAISVKVCELGKVCDTHTC